MSVIWSVHVRNFYAYPKNQLTSHRDQVALSLRESRCRCFKTLSYLSSYLFLADIFCDLGQFTFQRFNCPRSYTFTNARLHGGLQAGQFRRLGPPDDTELCVQRCCDQRSCDLVAWIGDHCYSVTCVNRELCKPVRLPSYDKGMRLLYIASRENAEDEGGQRTNATQHTKYQSY